MTPQKNGPAVNKNRYWLSLTNLSDLKLLESLLFPADFEVKNSKVSDLKLFEFLLFPADFDVKNSKVVKKNRCKYFFYYSLLIFNVVMYIKHIHKQIRKKNSVKCIHNITLTSIYKGKKEL